MKSVLNQVLGFVGVSIFSLFMVGQDSAHAVCAKKKSYSDCAGSHCSRMVDGDAEFNEWCVETGLAGCPVLVKGVAKQCYCMCSCVAGDTLIQLANGETKMAKDIREGDEVVSPFGKQIVSKISALTASDATGFVVLKLFLDNGKDITVSENHVFLGVDNGFHSADALKQGDILASQTGSPITVLHIERIESFEGMLYNVVMNADSKDHMDHLLITNELVSGDFILQNEIDRQMAKKQ